MANEKRLIDANALIELFDERNSDIFIQYHTRENKEYWWGMNGGINWGVNTINNAPTVDAVEVVRCKDCKHYKPRNQSAHWKQIAPCCMRSAALQFPENGFYSYGERKDNEDK